VKKLGVDGSPLNIMYM